VKKFLHPGGMTDEAVSGGFVQTIRARPVRSRRSVILRSVAQRLNLVCLASIRDTESFRVMIRGYLRVAPQLPANVYDPSGVKRMLVKALSVAPWGTCGSGLRLIFAPQLETASGARSGDHRPAPFSCAAEPEAGAKLG
jgi:hypothetical protein